MDSAHPPVVVVNPTASRLHDPDRRRRIVAGVTAAVGARTGLDPIVVDASPDRAREWLAAAAAAAAPLVAVVGGDGTIRESAAALAGTGVPMAIVPAGTGNVFAAALGVPRDTEGALRMIEVGRPVAIDIGRATWGPVVDGVPGDQTGSHSFAVACGVGFDARVMAAATTDLKRRFGFAAYVVSALRQAARLRPTRFRIDADGDELDVRGLVVLIANCGEIVPGFIGPRQAIDPTDGLLDVFVVTAAGLPGGLAGAAEALLASGAAQSGRHHLRLRTRRVRVVADPAEPVQVDGDPHRADWLEASLHPGAVTVLRP